MFEEQENTKTKHTQDTATKNKCYTNDEKKKMVLDYLKNRYGEEFLGLSYEPEELLQGYDKLYVYPKNKTKEDAFLVIGDSQDGQYIMEDGYLGIIIRPEYEKAIRRIIDKFYCEYKTYLTINSGDLSLRWNNVKEIKKINLKDEITNVDMDTHVYVKQSIASGKDIKVIVEKIAEQMVKNRMVGKIDINVIKDSRYNHIKLDKENWQNATASENMVEDYYLRVDKNLKIIDYGKGE